MKNQTSQKIIDCVGEVLSLKTGMKVLVNLLDEHTIDYETHFYALDSDKCISVKSSRTRFYLTSSEGWCAEIWRKHREEF